MPTTLLGLEPFASAHHASLAAARLAAALLTKPHNTTPNNHNHNDTCSDCFRHYVAQDAHFLHFFARAYAAALDKVPGSDSGARNVLQQLLMGGESGGGVFVGRRPLLFAARQLGGLSTLS